MDSQIKLTAEEFVRSVRSSQVMKQFQVAKDRYDHDPEVSHMRNQFTVLTREFRQKQYNNTLTREELEHYKTLQQTLSSHPISRDFAQAQQQLIELLQECNMGLSQVLGFDFAATAAPAASC